MQAVDTMLEVVPKGVNKWSGIQALLQSLQIPVEVSSLCISAFDVVAMAPPSMLFLVWTWSWVRQLSGCRHVQASYSSCRPSWR